MCPPVSSSKCCRARWHLHAFFMVLPSRSAHMHTSIRPHCECCLVSSISPTILCVFCSFRVSFFPKAVYSGHLVALTPYVRCLGFRFFLFSPQWRLLNDNNLGMLNVLLTLSIHNIVLVKLWHSTELLPLSFLWVSGSETLKICCLWFLTAVICLYDFMIRQCGIT